MQSNLLHWHRYQVGTVFAEIAKRLPSFSHFQGAIQKAVSVLRYVLGTFSLLSKNHLDEKNSCAKCEENEARREQGMVIAHSVSECISLYRVLLSMTHKSSTRVSGLSFCLLL